MSYVSMYLYMHMYVCVYIIHMYMHVQCYDSGDNTVKCEETSISSFLTL
jgi:hypothetical protein